MQAKSRLFCSFCSQSFIMLHFCVRNEDRFFARKFPTPHRSSTHHDTHPHRGQVTFTVLLPSGATHSWAKGKLKVFSPRWLAMAKVSEILAGLSNHPDSHPEAEAARKPHGRWMDTRRAGSSPCSGAGDCSPVACALPGPYSWMSSSTQPPPD